MAQTLTEILADQQLAKSKLPEIAAFIDESIANDATLSDLNSTSKTSDFREWGYVNSATSLLMQLLWDERKKEFEALAASAITGDEQWLQKELLKFQYGDSLSVDVATGKYFYSLIDEEKQIIKRCSVVTEGGITRIKVAKVSGSNPIPLTAPELASFTTYVRRIKFAGSKVADPTSGASDKLNAPMTVYYNGLRTLDDIKLIVETAFNNYLGSLPFNGQYSINKHGDFVESSSADINQVDMGLVQAKAEGGVYINVNRVYLPLAGYLERDTAIDFNTMVTYVAQ